MNGRLQSNGQSTPGAAGDGEPAGDDRVKARHADKLLIPGLGNNLRAGLRLAVIGGVSLQSFRIDFSQVVALFVLDAAIALLGGFLVIEPPRAFDIYGLTGYATHQLAFIAGVLLVAAWLNQPARRLALFVLLLSASTIVHAIALPFAALQFRGHLFDDPWLASWAFFLAPAAWGTFIAGRAMRLVSGRQLRHLVLPASGYALVIYGMVFVVPHSQMWYSQAPPGIALGSDRPEYVDAESTYYDQGRLMRASLEGLEPERPGVSDLYFVGFANDAHQEVFRKEIELARTLMDERFDTGGRSMMLINNPATVEQVPLANRPNLALTLKAIGQRMNTDEDVLFLFLTSHGTPDGVLAARFWPIHPNNLSSKDLKRLLDRSGIRWRILVVSACYSGTFIDPLKDDYTLILTASRKDRNSFGCGSDREYTYFGEHFFAQELSSGKPLLEAFEAARVSLARREKSEGYPPSEPQMHVGELMRAKLAEIEARLDQR
jgi:hypothetical protein